MLVIISLSFNMSFIMVFLVDISLFFGRHVSWACWVTVHILVFSCFVPLLIGTSFLVLVSYFFLIVHIIKLILLTRFNCDNFEILNTKRIVNINSFNCFFFSSTVFHNLTFYIFSRPLFHPSNQLCDLAVICAL